MSLANYADLKTATADWLYRAGDPDLAARAADLITLFERDFVIDPEMRSFEMETLSTALITSAATALPADYIDMIRLQVIASPAGTPNQVLTFATASQAAELDATTCGSGIVQNYTTLAGQIFVSPQKWAPIGATLEMVYYGFAPLSDTNTSNWLLQKYPNLYLYGTLMQAAAYVDNDEAVVKWKAARDEAMAKLARTERKRKLGAGPLVVRSSGAVA